MLNRSLSSMIWSINIYGSYVSKSQRDIVIERDLGYSTLCLTFLNACILNAEFVELTLHTELLYISI